MHEDSTVISENKRAIVSQLKQRILRWQGFRPPESPADQMGLGPVEAAFPHGVFPTGSVHEFISRNWEEEAATSGFISGLLSRLMQGGKVCLWISPSRLLFPPATQLFGVAPDRIIFVEVAREKDGLWVMEEALKCSGLAAVVAELRELDFVQSRRLQLAVEKSGITGFIFRSTPRHIGATACTARWHITPLPSQVEAGLPGVGFPKWQVSLLKVRNGNPGSWQLAWSAGHFVPIASPTTTVRLPKQGRKSG